MSISCTLFAGQGRGGQHHEHQLHFVCGGKAGAASIMSISCTLFAGVSHEHQLHFVCGAKAGAASIMSISCTLFAGVRPGRPAS